MRVINIIIGLLFIMNVAPGQELLSPPLSKFITSFHFKQFSGGVMIVKAQFENIKDSLNFILDTGSGGISLDSSTCEEFNIASVLTDTTITGIGGIRKTRFVFNKTLRFPGLEVSKLNFHINDYNLLSSVYGEKIDGIIGYSFFKRYIVKINFDSLEIEVYSPGKINYPKGGTLLYPIFTSLPIQYLQLKDKRRLSYNFYFDTGAGLCFLMSEKFAKDSAILLQKRKPVYTQAQGMAGRSQMKLTVIKELKIGPYKFRKVPTYIYDDEYNVTSYPFSGGLIGNELLKHFNVILNYGQREIHLRPNSHFLEPFDYAYTGLGIYYTDGKIIVEDIIPNSPADKCGFKIDDQIMGVAGNFSNNIQAYKNLLQVPNQKIKVVVKRKTGLIILEIKVKSILR
ncbi:MAG: aspartyl protease family protein [Bacteroidetes bacterium]|nr:aspartyl protease family protein [Bacteroidota bacterium]MBS1755925.1 aspartyl protease family protein [Bacteroidota bacterium]